MGKARYMRKKRKQKAIFSTIAGIEVESSPTGTVPPTPDVFPKDRQEKVQRLPGPKPFEPENAPAEPPEAGVLEVAPPPQPMAAAPLEPGCPAAPTVETFSPAAENESPDTTIETAEAATPITPGPAEPETLPVETEPRFFISLKLAAESLNFGRVLAGDFADRNLDVKNEGNCQCVLTDLRGLPAAGFSLVAPPRLPLTLGPAGSQLLTVRFSPDSLGKKTARLSIEVSDQDGPAAEVSLTGEAARAFTTQNGIYYSPVFNSLDMSFVYIAPGVFLIGSPENEPGRNNDEKQHEVTLTRGVYLQCTPVTQGQWQALMGSNPAGFPTCGDDCPVENVSWNDCQEFIKKLNLLEEGDYRLPTEAEWEYACRAGGVAALGDRELTALFCENDPFLDAVAWYCGNSNRVSHPVALKSPNAWELYDMHGNVMEWCRDWYGEYPEGSATDPVGAPAGVGRVIRGGSWFSSAKNCRAAYRFKWAPNSRSHYLGFRLVKKA